MDKLTRLDSKSCRRLLECGLDGDMRPVAQLHESSFEGLQTAECTWLFETFFDSLRIKRKRIREKKSDPIGHIAEVFDFGLNDGEGLNKGLIRAIGNAGFIHERLRELGETRQAHRKDVLPI